MAKNFFILSEEAKRDLVELAAAVRQLGGVQALRNLARPKPDPGPPFRVGRIVAATATSLEDANSNPVRWTYEIEEITKTASGYDGWTAIGKGYTSNLAYNFAEMGNAATGRQMNGVDHDGADYPAGFAMQPVQVNAIVMFIYVPVAADLVEAWFWPPGYNGEDGTCS
jgi:hypothetical protein